MNRLLTLLQQTGSGIRISMDFFAVREGPPIDCHLQRRFPAHSSSSFFITSEIFAPYVFQLRVNLSERRDCSVRQVSSAVWEVPILRCKKRHACTTNLAGWSGLKRREGKRKKRQTVRHWIGHLIKLTHFPCEEDSVLSGIEEMGKIEIRTISQKNIAFLRCCEMQISAIFLIQQRGLLFGWRAHMHKFLIGGFLVILVSVEMKAHNLLNRQT